MRKPIDVIILGAGAAGLAAARVLSDAGRRILILEARGRIGGRIHTIHDPAFATPIDLGAEFIHGRPESTWNYIRESGLAAIDLPFDSHRKHAGRLGKLDDFSDELGRVMGGLAHLRGKDISFAEYLRRHHGKRDSAQARKLALAFVEGFDAADPERISARSLAQEQEGLGDVGEEKQFRLLAGYSALMDHLRHSLDPKRTTIHLNTAAQEIRWQHSKVEVSCHRMSSLWTTAGAARGKPPKSQTHRAPRLLITLPVGILQLPPEHHSAVRFTPDIPAKRLAADKLGSGPVVKVVLKFHEPFWENPAVIRAARADDSLKDASFLHNPDAPFPTFWTARPLRLPILTGWAGGPKALALSGLAPQKLVGFALDTLADLFNLRRARLAALLDKAYTADWPADPFARGAYSYVTVGASKARADLARPIARTLFFAGEACDTSGQASTVAGALASGQHAAKAILSS